MQQPIRSMDTRTPTNNIITPLLCLLPYTCLQMVCEMMAVLVDWPRLMSSNNNMSLLTAASKLYTSNHQPAKQTTRRSTVCVNSSH
jgi:hypothetical protein